MRKRPDIQLTSEDDFLSPELEKALLEISKRLERLEAAVFPKPAATEKRTGRKPRLAKEKVLERRRYLTTWIEQNWPDLRIDLLKAKTPQEAVQAILKAKEVMPGVFQPPFYHSPEKFEAPLWEFLKSKRFRQNPRNLAGAMAGLPELGWKRSFNISTETPDHTPPVLQAYRDHMRRSFPERLRELDNATTPEDVTKVLSKSRTDDPTYLHLKEHPDKVLEWLDAGKPTVISPKSKDAKPVTLINLDS